MTQTIDKPVESHKRTLSSTLILIMAIACGMTVANLYYNQPLLGKIASDLKVSERQAGFIPMLTQIGCAAGMLLFVPMGDTKERRRLIVMLLIAVSVAQAIGAISPSLIWLCAASLAIGLTSVIPHLIVPFAAQLAAPDQRGRAVGSVMSGLLIGILLARTVSGYIGDAYGWRTMYSIAALLMVGLILPLRRLLPRSVPSTNLTYPEILISLRNLIRTQPTLRQAAAIGALTFGAFSAFWTTLVFLLQGATYHLGKPGETAGLFGLVGVVGALAAPLMGRLADRKGPRFTLSIALCTTLISYFVFLIFGQSLWGLAAGVILLDFGVQSAHVSNQSRIYALIPEARSRLNTVYMVSYFIGGALGSELGSYAWSLYSWPGVCTVGLILSASALLLHLVSGGGNRHRNSG